MTARKDGTNLINKRIIFMQYDATMEDTTLEKSSKQAKQSQELANARVLADQQKREHNFSQTVKLSQALYELLKDIDPAIVAAACKAIEPFLLKDHFYSYGLTNDPTQGIGAALSR